MYFLINLIILFTFSVKYNRLEYGWKVSIKKNIYNIKRPKQLKVEKPKEIKRFKIVLLGDTGVGKTSLLRQYTNK